MKLSKYINEENFEKSFEKKLNKIGWNSIKNIFFRKNKEEVINKEVFIESLKKLNPYINESILEKIFNEIYKNISNSYVTINKTFCKYILETIKIYDERNNKYINIKLIDNKNIELNNFQLVRQMRISGNFGEKIPDIILFINGLPIIVIELKSEIANETIQDAFDQIEHYKNTIPQLFYFNLFSVITNKWIFKYGSITSKFSHFFKLFDFSNIENNEEFIFNKKIEFFFNKERIINMIFKYSFFNKKDIKFIAAQHQIRATENTIKRLKLINNNKIEKNKGGIVWHTQGSGKTITMILICKEIKRVYPDSLIILINDRIQLNEQITERFSKAERFLWTENIENIKSKDDLIKILKNNKKSGIFSITTQKFDENINELSNYKNIFILVDEAHRTQNIEEKFLISKNKKIKYKRGLGSNLRKAFPNATFIGFTATPLFEENYEKNTENIFGPFNDKYFMKEAIYDEMVVPIVYELRKKYLSLNQENKKKLDILQNKLEKSLNSKTNYLNNKIILEIDKIIESKVLDILNHWEKRKQILNGKSLIIANSRNAALKYYLKIIELKPELNKEIILIITKSNKDSKEMLESRVKDKDLLKVTNDFQYTKKYKIAIVVDKWLTGFDCQDLDTLYLDKIMKKHSLMQAITRINRTFEQKNQKKYNGLIIDYIGIFIELKKTLKKYFSDNNEDFNNFFPFESIENKIKKVFEVLNEIKEKYINDLFDFFSKKDEEIEDFLYKIIEKLLCLNIKKHIEFFKLNNLLQNHFNASYTELTEKYKKIIKFIKLIKIYLKILLNKKENEKDIFVISKIKEEIEKIINVEKTSMNKNFVIDIRNIKENEEDLIHEIEKQKNKNKRLAFQLYFKHCENKIIQLKNKNFILAKKLSQKLIELINKLNNTNIEKLQFSYDEKNEKIKEFLNEIKEEEEKMIEFKNNFILQSFFEVIKADFFLKKFNTKEKKKIVFEIKDIIKNKITNQYIHNTKIRSKLQFEIFSFFKKNYSYINMNFIILIMNIIDYQIKSRDVEEFVDLINIK